MVDYRQDPCHCHNQPHTFTPAFNPNHCHYEHHREDSRGPLHRTISSSTRDCHLHDPTSHDHPCPGARQPECRDCNHNRSHRSTERNGENTELVRALEEVLRNRSITTDVSQLLQEAVRRPETHHSSEQDALGAIIRLLGDVRSTNNGTPRHNTNQNTLIDLLLRISSNGTADPTATFAPRENSPRYLYSLDDSYEMAQTAAGRTTFTLPTHGRIVEDSGCSTPIYEMYARPRATRVRNAPAWMSGVWH